MHIEFHGAAGEVTGSCHLIECQGKRILLDCGLIQGSRKDEVRNAEPFSFDPKSIDAVILSHSHIDHSGRIPLLVKSGFSGPVFTQRASRDLCRIMLKDAAHLNEKEAEWENRKRERKGLKLVEPLYGLEDAHNAMNLFKGVQYGTRKTIAPGISFRLQDAGHILGSAIIELWLEEKGVERKLVFSGDLGVANRPILRDPTYIEEADIVIMESTYGDRLHRPVQETMEEMDEIFRETSRARGNILIPAFAVGRTQHLIHEFARHYQDWHLDQWQIFLDSPMAIEATAVYARHTELYDEESAELWQRNQHTPLLPNFHFSRTSKQSMNLNRVSSGAIIIAGSGMCTGGRIKHHLKHNVWRKDCHIVMVGYQAQGTPGRALVEGASHIRLWGEALQVNATVHTVGGLSAHADQSDLIQWYGHFNSRPPLVLVHGEKEAMQVLTDKLKEDLLAPVHQARPKDNIDLLDLGKTFNG